MSFASSGTQEGVQEAVTRHLAKVLDVPASDLVVTVVKRGDSSGRRLTGISWEAFYEVEADIQTAGHAQQAAEAMSADAAAAAADMSETFADAGLQLDEASVSVAEPEVKIVTVTATTASATSTSQTRSTTSVSATSGTTSATTSSATSLRSATSPQSSRAPLAVAEQPRDDDIAEAEGDSIALILGLVCGTCVMASVVGVLLRLAGRRRSKEPGNEAPAEPARLILYEMDTDVTRSRDSTACNNRPVASV